MHAKKNDSSFDDGCAYHQLSCNISPYHTITYTMLACHTSRSLRVAVAAAAHHSSFNSTGRQQVLIIKSQLLGHHRTRQIDPSTDLRFKKFFFYFPRVSSLFTCREIGVKGISLSQASRAASGRSLLGRKEHLAQAPLRTGGAPPSC